MRYLYGLGILCCLVLWSSCRNDFESVPSTGNLEFSRDTVYLDTIFSEIGSSTYNLKVYNRSDEDINIPSIRLGQGEESFYRLNVDGLPGKTFQDIQVMAKDSIFIFVETTADIEELSDTSLEFLYTDKILFDTDGNQQDVDLVTLVKDAVFLFPEDLGDGMFETLNLGPDPNNPDEDVLIEGFFLDNSELNFTNEKPYVIYGYAAVGAGKTLTIDAGARVHFHEGSGILVGNTGSIKVNGVPSNDPELMEGEVIFEGDRLEPLFEDVPGQWGTLWLTAGSTDNVFTHTTIKNNVVGILMDSNDGGTDPTLTLKNVQIYNAANIGLLGKTANIDGENLVINNSGQASLACSFGGTYNFRHSTFANYWTNSFRTFPAVQLDNFIDTGDGIITEDLLAANFTNCIIYGNERRELGLVASDDALFLYKFENCLIRFEDPNDEFLNDPLYQFGDSDLFPGLVRNTDPVFQNTNLNNFNIESGNSGAEGIGKSGVAPAQDLNGTSRDAINPDAGAYEATTFPDGD